MTEIQEALKGALQHLTTILPTLAVGIVLAWLCWVAVGRAARSLLPAEVAALLQRTVTAVVLGLALANALQQVGINLSVLLGAASVLTVAVGFAAQTSTSNFISGLFLIAERPFTVGDLIQVSGFTGEVMAIDLLSVKVRTFDNRYIRLPNEAVMKTEIVNLTRYPIRRIDISLALTMMTDIEETFALLLSTARSLPLVLDEPGPSIFFEQFDETGMRIKLTAWASRESFYAAQRELAVTVHRRLREAGVGVFVREVRLSPSASMSLFASLDESSSTSAAAPSSGGSSPG